MTEKRTHKVRQSLIAITCLSLLIAGVLFAHDGATGIVKERMDAMNTMRIQSKSVGEMFKGKAEFDIGVIQSAAEAYIDHGSRITGLFPDTQDSRNGANSEALPAIWEQWDDFDRLSNELVTQSESLKELVATTEDQALLKRAFFKTTKSCSGCHKRFRKVKH